MAASLMRKMVMVMVMVRLMMMVIVMVIAMVMVTVPADGCLTDEEDGEGVYHMEDRQPVMVTVMGMVMVIM
jgi:hypothetical protein